MEFPVRCFTCGSVIGHKYDEYRSGIRDKNPDVVLDELGMERYCCRRMFLAHVDIISQVLKYPRV
ncbi:DNA-directed RNA polymerase subunit N [Candidatus Micrarchaeota archaeon]|nr:DNA-directed RNA polymerase subunit N [Candidatus Micrarchaeota archaeon]